MCLRRVAGTAKGIEFLRGVTTVVNVRSTLYDVYIGRPSKWGNPFAIGGSYGPRGRLTRAKAIELYRQYWYSDGCAELRAQARAELKDKVLGCWCKPKDCHGDVIAEYLNGQGPPDPPSQSPL
jgi:hypothetical protein